ncbi:MAG: hypothetical protein NC342_01185 [Pseudoflavonifractor sp.]|nr:hypothetical protein [Alloprevotella sp.]MCM1116137.1 hypothetical protein [Pseudoflavonifractor sp.]
MKKFTILSLIAVIATLLTSCDGSSLPHGDNGIYYWQTTFGLDDAEHDFLHDHSVKRLYLKMFDLDYGRDLDDDYTVIPEATVRFRDTIPRGLEIIPTVFITQSAIKQMQMVEDRYAEKILKRINAMCRKNGITYKEIQLDCDWTKQTRAPFYALCKAMKEQMDSSLSLSSTIRLHQLTQTPPPVDKGVLMVYNTGDVTNMSAENSIFSLRDIEPYLRDYRLARYRLPLDVAYPAYGWSVIFTKDYYDNYSFSRLCHYTDCSSNPDLKKIGPNTYRAIKGAYLSTDDGNVTLKPDDIIRVERPEASEILKVKSMIEKQLKGKPHSTIIYHLDQSQLSRYSNHEINQIYSYD